jgi:acetyl esterase/lipase
VKLKEKYMDVKNHFFANNKGQKPMKIKIQPIVKAISFASCLTLTNTSFADPNFNYDSFDVDFVASNINYNGVNCKNSDAAPDINGEGIIYGTLEPNRQWFNIYSPDSTEDTSPKPVFLYSHSNGVDRIPTACDVSKKVKDIVTSEGYTLVSWESINNIETGEETLDTWEDSKRLITFLRAHADMLKLDMSHIIVGGNSRGSGASWKFAHSNTDDIRGIYMPQALPDPFWNKKINGENWDPKLDVTSNSKPIYLTYNPATIDPPRDIHDPARGYDILDRYEDLGIGANNRIVLGIEKSDLFDFFPDFLSLIDTSDRGSNFTDAFDDNELDQRYQIYTDGAWEDRAWGVLESRNSQVSSIIVAGDVKARNYTVSGSLKTKGQRSNGSKNWEGARLVARASDQNNYYEAYVSANQYLVLRSVVNGSATTLFRAPVEIDPQVSHTLEVTLSDNTIEITASDNRSNTVFSRVYTDDDHAAGQAGFKSMYCNCRYDDLIISAN